MEKRGSNKRIILISVIVTVILAGIIIGVTLLLPKTNLDGQGGSGEVSPLSEQCNFACESGQKVAFCNVERKVTDELKLTCNKLATDSKYSIYGVNTCPSVSC